MGGWKDTETSLSADERRVLGRFLARLDEQLGDRVISVWLYGSRARGEPPHPESDVDVMVIVSDEGERDLVWDLMFKAAMEEDANPFLFSVQVFDPKWIEGRREIKSFYIQEVDRDKVVLAGRP